jgi:predicted dehydrogenase
LLAASTPETYHDDIPAGPLGHPGAGPHCPSLSGWRGRLCFRRYRAVASRHPDAEALAHNFPGARVIAGYEALLADRDIDAVYIATPHPLHKEWALAAMAHGKHVLCEKPMSMSLPEVQAMFDAARKAGTFLGEAYMYRFHPLVSRILELVRAGAIGDVRLIQSSFGFAAGNTGPGDRLFSPELGGGAILDIGGYPASMAALLAGCVGPDEQMVEPEHLEAMAHIGETGVDEWSCAILRFPGDILATLSCSITLDQDNVLRIMGTRGRLEVDEFWFGSGKDGGVKAIRLFTSDGRLESIPITEARNLYSFQFEAANQAIRAGAGEFPSPA